MANFFSKPINNPSLDQNKGETPKAKIEIYFLLKTTYNTHVSLVIIQTQS